MTELQRSQAPGCFGAASVFSMDSKVCQGCVAFEACNAESMKTLEAIQSTINVKDILAKHVRARQQAQAKAEADRIRQAASVPPVKFAKAAAAVEKAKTPAITQPAAITQPVKRKTTVEQVTFEISAEHQAALARIGNVKTYDQAVILCRQNKITECREGLAKGVNPFAETGPAFLRVACDLLMNGGFTKATLKARFVAEFGWTDNTAGSHVAMSSLLFYFGIMVSQGEMFVLNPALG